MSGLDQITHAATLALGDSDAAAREALSAVPWLTRAIDEDTAGHRFGAWGHSTAIDENTGTAVIPRALFDELHRCAGIPASWPVGNAGLLHCYGYLLSLEATPYGLKRDRWIGSALAHACALPAEAFTPWAAGATLLARASAAASGVLASPAASATHIVDGRRMRVALSSADGPAALAYEASSSPTSAPLLVTLFPVADARAVLAEFQGAPRLRWNAA